MRNISTSPNLPVFYLSVPLTSLSFHPATLTCPPLTSPPHLTVHLPLILFLITTLYLPRILGQLSDRSLSVAMLICFQAIFSKIYQWTYLRLLCGSAASHPADICYVWNTQWLWSSTCEFNLKRVIMCCWQYIWAAIITFEAQPQVKSLYM